MKHPGTVLREALRSRGTIQPFMGVFDAFSATIAGRHSKNLFLSGFGFSASFYGLPDRGYTAWTDICNAAIRIRHILPDHGLMVDIDDGFVDVHTAVHVVTLLETFGVAMVMLEDQTRPRRCGHVDGKVLATLPEYLVKLNAVLEQRTTICVAARTDAAGDEALRRLDAISSTTADVVIVDGLRSETELRKIVASTDKPVMYNQLQGGKSPNLPLSVLRDIGVAVFQFSTPLLFAAQEAMEQTVSSLLARDGLFASNDASASGLAACDSLLQSNEKCRRLRESLHKSVARTLLE